LVCELLKTVLYASLALLKGRILSRNSVDTHRSHPYCGEYGDSRCEKYSLHRHYAISAMSCVEVGSGSLTQLLHQIANTKSLFASAAYLASKGMAKGERRE